MEISREQPWSWIGCLVGDSTTAVQFAFESHACCATSRAVAGQLLSCESFLRKCVRFWRRACKPPLYGRLDVDETDLRLSRIETLWSVVRKAHTASGESARSAQELLLSRYGGAIRRYLLGALRDEEAAEEAFQEFSLRLIQGAFRNADPGHGRFRNFVKTSLFHLIVDQQRRARRNAVQKRPLEPDTPDRQVHDDDLAEQERAFLRSWREELLARCWNNLAEFQRKTGKPYDTVLRFRLAHSDMHSPELAAALSQELGKPINAGAVRVLLHRAREMFADLLLDVVLNSLEEGSLEEAEQELIELGLLHYCRPALARRGYGQAIEEPQV